MQDCKQVFSRYYGPILLILYLIGCFSPLRLEFDSVRYFAIKDCLDAGCPADSAAAKDFLPYGYPILLLALSKVGLLNSFSIAFINGIFLISALVLVRKILNPFSPFVFYTILLLNWTIIKLFAYPLSEMQYLFFSAASIYFFYQRTKTKKVLPLLWCFVLASVAVFTRAIGMVLVVALLLGLIWEHRKLVRNKKYLAGGLILIALIIVFVVLALPMISHYVNALMYRAPGGNHIEKSFVKHTTEWGQLLLNMPMGKLNAYLSAGWVNAIFLLAGLVLLAWFIFSLVKQRKAIHAVIIIYLITYSFVVFNWSYADPRFWVPVLPFIAGIILKSPPKWYGLKIVFFAYSLMGLVSFGYSFYTQFNKEAFARNQANGIFRKEYEIHFFGKTLPDTTSPVNPAILRLLEKYD